MRVNERNKNQETRTNKQEEKRLQYYLADGQNKQIQNPNVKRNPNVQWQISAQT
jgi:hypothetical protein